MRVFRLHILIVTCMLLLPLGVGAKSPVGYLELQAKISNESRNFRHLTVNDGFSRSAILDILQDENEMLWFAAWDGLYSYDGYKLKRVCQPIRSQSGEPAVIVSIIEAPHHQIWMQTFSGIFIWDDVHHSLSRFNSKAFGVDSIRGKSVFLEKDLDNRIWFATDENRIYAYDGSIQRLTEIYDSSVGENVAFRSMYVDHENNKWICTKNKGIFKLALNEDGNAYRLTRDPLFDDFSTSSVFCLFQDEKKHYWVATNEAIYRLKNSDNPTEKQNIKIRFPKNVSQNEIRIFNFAEKGEYIFASTNKGLFIYTQHSEPKWIKATSRIEGLNDHSIRSALIDKEGGLWLATFNGGVNYLSPTAENFTSFNYLNNESSGHVVSGFVEDPKGNLWISYDDGGFCRWNRTTDNVESWSVGESKDIAPTVNNIQSIFFDDNKLYLGLFNGGMDVFDLYNKTKCNYNKKNTKPSPLSKSIYGFHRLNAHQILLATMDGLFLYDKTTQEFHWVAPNQGRVNCIAEDQDHNIWVASRNGLFCYSANLELKEHFLHNDADSTSLISNNITTLCSFGSVLYIGTNGKGVWTLQRNERTFKSLGSNVFSGAAICKIIVDQDNLWISTNKGLYNYNTSSQQTRVYTAHDGLCYNQFKINSGLLASDHTLFFGSVYGITGFKPHELVHNNFQPKAVITDLYVLNKPVNLLDKNSPLASSVTYADNISLHQRYNSLTFKVSSSSYSQPDMNVFEYKLVPFDKEWQRTNDASNSVSYTNLPSGEYTLHVRTSSGNHIWSKERCLDINIQPYWWASLPMKFLYAFVLVGIFGVFIFRYIRKKRKEIYLLQLEKEQEAYHTKMEFFTFMIHEIRTPLALILGPVSDIMERKGNIDDVRTELNTIKRNGNRLLTLVNQLMDFRKVEEKSYVVQLGTIDLQEQIEQIVQNFKYNCTQRSITLISRLPEQKCWATADKEAMNKIMTNLLSNASKFTTDRIEISLDFASESSMWKISVKDNGKGIDKAHQNKIFNSFYQVRQNLSTDYIGTGVGLSVVKHLVEIQGGTVSVESNIGQGTCFIVSIPAASQEVIEKACCEIETKEVCPEESSQHRLLVVEDNDDMRQYISSIFNSQYAVDVCRNGKEALELTRENGYELVLTDWMMPEMDGIQLSRILKSQDETSHIPIVILTARDDEGSQIEGFMAHADAYVVKPFSSKVLFSQVEAIIKNRETVHKEFLKQPDTTEEILCQNEIDKKFIEKLNMLIDERIMNTSISVDDLAANLCMGRTSFYQKVKGIVGVTPNEYISTYKLKKAAQLLKSGNVRINEICYMTGFSTSSYFAKKFTAQFGMSPSEYMKSSKS